MKVKKEEYSHCNQVDRGTSVCVCVLCIYNPNWKLVPRSSYLKAIHLNTLLLFFGCVGYIIAVLFIRYVRMYVIRRIVRRYICVPRAIHGFGEIVNIQIYCMRSLSLATSLSGILFSEYHMCVSLSLFLLNKFLAFFESRLSNVRRLFVVCAVSVTVYLPSLTASNKTVTRHQYLIRRLKCDQIHSFSFTTNMCTCDTLRLPNKSARYSILM